MPTLLGFAVVALSKPGGTDRYPAAQLARVPERLRHYIEKLKEWSRPKLVVQGSRSNASERSNYGACPKTPLPAMSWVEAAEALRSMKLLGESYLPVEQSDKYNVNKFLNR